LKGFRSMGTWLMDSVDHGMPCVPNSGSCVTSHQLYISHSAYVILQKGITSPLRTSECSKHSAIRRHGLGLYTQRCYKHCASGTASHDVRAHAHVSNSRRYRSRACSLQFRSSQVVTTHHESYLRRTPSSQAPHLGSRNRHIPTFRSHSTWHRIHNNTNSRSYECQTLY
jgi:hypothetical protein